MSSPLERLQAIVRGATPSKMLFKAVVEPSKVVLVPTVLEPFKLAPSTDALQPLLASQIKEVWDHNKMVYQVVGHETDLFRFIKNSIIVEYAQTSSRSSGTQRKTELFIQSIDINNNLLANYLLQFFININSSEFRDKSRLERQEKFETLESLRRVYGKQC